MCQVGFLFIKGLTSRLKADVLPASQVITLSFMKTLKVSGLSTTSWRVNIQ